MTLRKISRARPVATPSFCATPAGAVRVASHRCGSGKLLMIWLGRDVAANLGLVEDRHLADVLVDDTASALRLGIRPSVSGEFRVSRRGQSFAVYIDRATAGELLADNYAWDIIPPEELEFSGTMVAFDLPVKARDFRP